MFQSRVSITPTMNYIDFHCMKRKSIDLEDLDFEYDIDISEIINNLLDSSCRNSPVDSFENEITRKKISYPIKEKSKPINKRFKYEDRKYKDKKILKENNWYSTDSKIKEKYGRILKRIDNLKMYCHGIGMSVNIDYVKDLNLSEQKQGRAGVIPYVEIDSVKHFALGVDTNFGNFTDFGGGSKKSDLNCIETAIREFNEETLKVFTSLEEIDRKRYDESLAIYNENIIIIFLKVKCDIKEVTSLFQTRCLEQINPEVNEIFWINEFDFIKILNKLPEPGPDKSFIKKVDHLNNPCIYTRIHPLLLAAIVNHNFIYRL